MDRISALPDDIIRQIIDRSESPNKLSCLSKTWNQILLSYPIFKFDYSALRSKQPDTRIASAESSKIFLQRLANTTNSSAESIRIKTCLHDDRGISDFGFLDDMFDSIARVSPREIDFDISTLSDFHDWPTLYSIPLGLFLHSNIQFFRRLTVLKLQGCNFHDYRFITNTNLFEGFGISLKVLRLELINFMYCKMRILDAMVACASRLETLELYNIFYYEFTNKLSITLSIEHLKFPSSSVSSQDHFLDVMLHMFHPKFISFTGEEDQIPNIDFQRALQDSCKQLVERSCCARRRSLSNSWHGQLKDVKLVTRSTNGCIREDKVVDVLGDVVSSLVEGDRVSFMLTWD
ncbi:hypothetical protein LINPERPRIM_LOCUS3569 [Linum perenne]